MSKNTWMAGLVVAAVAVFGLATSSMSQEKDKPAPINDKCPLTGKDIDAKQASEVKVSFCCANCKGKFDKEPTAALGKVDKLPNEKCPMAGKAVADASSTVTVAFCCGNCKGKFDKDPAASLGKVKAKEAKK